MLALINAYRRYAAAVVSQHGGVLAGSRVREVLAYFGYPVAQEHAANARSTPPSPSPSISPWGSWRFPPD